MSPGDASGRPGRGGRLTSNLQVGETGSESTARVRQTRQRHVWAETTVVRGRVRSRLLLLCVGAGGCGARHVHNAPVDMVSGVRPGACGNRYVVHTGVDLAQVVA